MSDNANTSKNSVEVSVLSFTDLFGAEDPPPMPIAVDTYQRGFVWNEEKIQQLLTRLWPFLQPPSALTA